MAKEQFSKTYLGVIGSESTWVCWGEKQKIEEINRVCSLQNTQNNSPALCSVSGASLHPLQEWMELSSNGIKFLGGSRHIY